LALPVEGSCDDQDADSYYRERSYIDVPAKEFSCAHKNDGNPDEDADD